jgi:hypothetical protein
MARGDDRLTTGRIYDCIRFSHASVVALLTSGRSPYNRVRPRLRHLVSSWKSPNQWHATSSVPADRYDHTSQAAETSADSRP